MNFVSPRKLDRIRGFDYIYNDVCSGVINIWYFAELLDISADSVGLSIFVELQVNDLRELPFFKSIPEVGQRPIWLKENPNSLEEVSSLVAAECSSVSML